MQTGARTTLSLVLSAMLSVTLAPRSGSAGTEEAPGQPAAASPAAPAHTHGALRAIPTTILERPMARRLGIGHAHEAVSTKSGEAQDWYDEGLAHLYSFAWLDAARAFHMALRADPALAMAHVGLSAAYGGLGSLQGALAAVQRAQVLAATAGARDRIRIDLRRQQLEVLTGQRPAADYTAALERALAAEPADVALLLLRGEAASAAGGASGTASDAAAVPFFQRAQRADPKAFGPRHFLAHAYENSGQIDLALRESQAYAAMAPNVPHAHHMAGHGLRRVGRALEAIAAFERADALSRATSAADPIPAEYDWHTHHNTSLLAGTYRYVGRVAKAGDLLRQAFARPAPLVPEEIGKRDWPALLLAQGRPAEALVPAQQLAGHADPLVQAAGHLVAAHVHMAAGRTAAGGAEADAALRVLRGAGPSASELAPELRMAQGEFLLRTGERERGRTMMRQAVESLRARPGPDAWGQTLFAIEAAVTAARQAGDAELARLLTLEMQQHDPAYGGTALAVAQSAEERGDVAAARRAYADAVRRWQAADTDHPGLNLARRRLAALGQAAPPAPVRR